MDGEDGIKLEPLDYRIMGESMESFVPCYGPKEGSDPILEVECLKIEKQIV